MNHVDEKNRPEVGVKDMDKYEFGGLEIEKLLSNGYLMYVPYGIHVDIFNAIEKGISAMGKQKDSLNEVIRDIKHETNNDKLTEIFEQQIVEIDKNIAILEKIMPIQEQI